MMTGQFIRAAYRPVMKHKFALVMTLLLGVPFMSLAPVAAQGGGHTYILVHGAFQDASGWSSVVSALEAAGNTAVAVELPGRGDDQTPVSEITLATYRDAVVAVIEAQDQPVILVGHSFGGVVISAVAEAVPDRIESLVYVAAYVPRDNESLMTYAAQDRYSALGQEGAMIVSEDGTHLSVNADLFASIFCPDCSEDQAKVMSGISEPIVPLNEAVHLTAERFGTVARTYIMTAQDVIVSPQVQALMLSNTPVDHVYALNAGHAPYVTMPDALAELLIKVGA